MSTDFFFFLSLCGLCQAVTVKEKWIHPKNILGTLVLLWLKFISSIHELGVSHYVDLLQRHTKMQMLDVVCGWNSFLLNIHSSPLTIHQWQDTCKQPLFIRLKICKTSLRSASWLDLLGCDRAFKIIATHESWTEIVVDNVASITVCSPQVRIHSMWNRLCSIAKEWRWSQWFHFFRISLTKVNSCRLKFTVTVCIFLLPLEQLLMEIKVEFIHKSCFCTVNV